ncbi:MAG: metallophosphoesterase family protein [Methanomicrobiaceae archaeon]|nr:metallophosphoesterase family protein [Methanomicrobiaceae archaeon]
MGRFRLIALLLLIAAPIYPAGAAIVWGPVVTGTTEDTAVITWKAGNATSGWVEYAPDDAPGEWIRRDAEAEGDGLFRLFLDDLAPATAYRYRIGGIDPPEGVFRFRTFGEQEYTFIVYGDTRAQEPFFTQEERHRLVAERIAAEPDPLFVIHTGDFMTAGESESDGWDQFFAAASPFLGTTTLVPVIGNHDGPPEAFSTIFGVAAWYAFEAGGVRVVVLDSNDWAWPQMEEQTAWLELELQKPAAWTFAAFHHPPYTAHAKQPGGNVAIRNAWSSLFEGRGVSAVFNAHVHVYERYLVNGTQYMVVGCGGAPLYSLAPKKGDHYQSSLEYTLGYVRVHVSPEGVTAEMVPVAQISEDNREIVEIYPEGAVFETVRIAGHASKAQAGMQGWIPAAALGAAACLLLYKKRR